MLLRCGVRRKPWRRSVYYCWLRDDGLIRKIDIGCGRLLWQYAETSFHARLATSNDDNSSE
jgi:hypothetical protein